jgi:type I restriction enzyme M protein
MPKVLLNQIFKSDKIIHSITLFNQSEINFIEKKLFLKNDKPHIKCLASDKDRPAKPEEIVRQLWIKKILDKYEYPKTRIKVEYSVWFGSGVSDKSADIVILREDEENPYIIIEVKKPRRKDGIKQLKSYCNAEGSPIGVWSNGGELIILNREEPNIYSQISSIPDVNQTLQDVVSEQWTIDKLNDENKLVKQKLSLKNLILDLEDLVLANAEGIDDSFDEVFKLIYSKLYDEWAATNDNSRERKIKFRIYGESPNEIYIKINNLFNNAKDKWRGIFSRDEKIRLKPEHLFTCVSFMQDIKLFNANLQIIDEAFEYLITEVAKGKKGQYFTPRWVIDMCVKILNPKINERIIDTACGSSGFTVHSIFHIAGDKFSAEGLPQSVIEYAGQMVYGIDSSPKAVKIAKAVNLIAGDGKTNIFELNSLNSPKWNEEGKAGLRPLLTKFDNHQDDDKNQSNFENFDFDILMTNPPFAGNISERDILKQYRLAEKNGKTINKIGRDILFVEKNLNFLKPGGRMAIVLPQGRLNNSKDLFVRNFLFNKAKILGVIGLHANTFRPHTATKTSVIILQKYTNSEITRINEITNKYTSKWEKHLEELKEILENKKFQENEINESLLFFLKGIFDDLNFNEDSEDEDDIEGTIEELDYDQLKERIEELEKKLNEMTGRAKGKSSIRKALKETKLKYASRDLKSQTEYLIKNEKLLKDYSEVFINDQASKELDYNIFFAVSEKSGKDNGGNPVYKKDANNNLLLDDHNHLIIDHDLQEISKAFKKFGKNEKLDFT